MGGLVHGGQDGSAVEARAFENYGKVLGEHEGTLVQGEDTIQEVVHHRARDESPVQKENLVGEILGQAEVHTEGNKDAASDAEMEVAENAADERDLGGMAVLVALLVILRLRGLVHSVATVERPVVQVPGYSGSDVCVSLD